MFDLNAIKRCWRDVHWQYGQNSLSPEYIGDAWVYTPDLYTGTGEPLMHIDLDEPNPVEAAFLRLAAQAPGDIQALIEEAERLRCALDTIGTTIYTQGRGTKAEQELLAFIREQLGRNR